MKTVSVNDINNIEVPKAPKIYCETSYVAGFKRAIAAVLELNQTDKGVVPVKITDNRLTVREGYLDKTRNLIFLASMPTEFAKEIGLKWEEDEQPFGGGEP